MTAWQTALFLLCVALATCAQNLSGFAFALILLGLAGLLELAPLANVATVLALANALVALRERSSATSFRTWGVVSGLLTGLFSTGGPPLVYHLYRQPMPLRTVRDTLAATLAASSLMRLTMVLGTGLFQRQRVQAVPACRATGVRAKLVAGAAPARLVAARSAQTGLCAAAADGCRLAGSGAAADRQNRPLNPC